MKNFFITLFFQKFTRKLKSLRDITGGEYDKQTRLKRALVRVRMRHPNPLRWMKKVPYCVFSPNMTEILTRNSKA